MLADATLAIAELGFGDRQSEAGIALLMVGHMFMIRIPITRIYRRWGETRLSKAHDGSARHCNDRLNTSSDTPRPSLGLVAVMGCNIFILGAPMWFMLSSYLTNTGAEPMLVYNQERIVASAVNWSGRLS